MKKAGDKILYKRKQNKGKEFKDISDETYDKLTNHHRQCNHQSSCPTTASAAGIAQ